MIEYYLPSERNFALMVFTRELILQSKTPELIELEKNLILSEEIENRKRNFIQKRKMESPSLYRKGKLFQSNSSAKSPEFSKKVSSTFLPSISNSNVSKRSLSNSMQRVRIPDVLLPNRFGYLKPVQTSEQLDLGKLNSLIADGRVREIECDGPDTEIIARGVPDPRTNIFLTNEEIQSIFLAFSRAAKIPIEEDIVKIAAGGFILNGINSNVIGSRFVIKRIPNSFVR